MTNGARPKARLPRGFADRGPAEIRRVAQMTETIRGVFERWGFEPVETPLVEYADALGKFLPDQDRPNEGVFAFADDDGQWLSLRYDLTAPLARYVAENFERLPKPYKSYRAGWVFRNEKPGPGRFRQFMQFDADIVGSASPLADAEICMMAADTMEALGFGRGDYRIRVNSRRVLDGVLSALSIVDEKQKLAVLRSIDKLDKLDWEDVAQLLGKGRRDASGDFTAGAGLSQSQISGLNLFYSVPGIIVKDRPDTHADRSSAGLVTPGSEGVLFVVPEGASEAMIGAEPFVIDNQFTLSFLRGKLEAISANADATADMLAIADICGDAGFGSDQIVIDPSVVRGLEYYTGAVFEAELTFETTDEDGRPVRFGSVGGGGRYDGLVGRFRGDNVPATGFSVGVSRLAAALAARDSARANDGPVLVTVMDRSEIARAQALTAKLRAALNPPGAPPVPVEMYIGESGMKAQLKYADRRSAPVAIIEGSDERARGVVQVKDLAAGKAAAASIGERADWVAARPAQQEVAYDGTDVAKIAEAVRRILD